MMLARILNADPRLEVVAMAADAYSARREIKALKPDAIFIAALQEPLRAASLQRQPRMLFFKCFQYGQLFRGVGFIGMQGGQDPALRIVPENAFDHFDRTAGLKGALCQ